MSALEMLHAALASLAINGDPGAGLARRDKERAQIEGFLNSHIDERRGGVLYVCGPVGTGKTALICNSIAEQLKAQRRANVAVFNCVSQVDTAFDLYLWVAERLCLAKQVSDALSSATTQDKRINALVALIDKNYKQSLSVHHKRKHMVVMILDEMDDLSDVPLGKKALGKLFGWASDPMSRVILLGIGNDLVGNNNNFQSLTVDTGSTDTTKSATGPSIMRFGAYKAEDIEVILNDRLGKTGVYGQPVLKFISAQTERMGGDLRTALTLCREPLLRAFIKFGETKVAPKFPIGLGPVNAVAKELIDDTKALIAGLPSQQKLFLGAVYIAQCRHDSGIIGGDESANQFAVTRTEVHATYQAICTTLGGSALSIFVLFRESLGPLVDLNFVRTRGEMVELLVEPEDIIKGMSSTPLLQKLLQDPQNSLK